MDIDLHMKLIVFGSTGGIGRQVVEQALEAGHSVTAVARRPDAVAIPNERLTVVRGDVLEMATFAQAVHGQEAVVSAIGVSSLGPTTLYSQGVAHIVSAMKTAGVRRLVCVGIGYRNRSRHAAMANRYVEAVLATAVARVV